MKFKIIAAVCKGGGIGIDGRLPWKIKEDLAFFSKLTKGNGNNAVIMGRKTWDSLNNKHLIKRDNLIISNSFEIEKRLDNSNKELIKSFKNISDIVDFCTQQNYDQVWIIGGSTIYKEFLDSNLVDICCITYINKTYECDIFFPNLPQGWKLTHVSSLPNRADIEVRRLIKV
tara:strand:- start:119 stop:634 length:516 start_codon:yes stop_codon:yes gene_type:complete